MPATDTEDEVTRLSDVDIVSDLVKQERKSLQTYNI